MTMPVLGLTADRVAFATRLDLAVVENLMIWPDDGTARDEAMRTAVVQFGRDMHNAGQLPDHMVRDLISEAVDAAKPADLTEAAKGRVVEGLVAGIILYRAVAFHEMDPSKAAIGNNVETLSNRLFPTWRLRPKTIQNKVIPRFRPVAHFWASCVMSTLIEMRDGETSVFPCRRANLPSFLAAADEFRKRGETIRLAHAPGPLVAQGACVVIPAELGLPSVVLELP